MAFHSSLPTWRATEIYNALNENVSSEATAMYNANNKKAGQYKGVWSELLDLWLADKIPNFHVTDCLRLNQVLTYDLSDALELHKAIELQNKKLNK